jgi:hypothetical protein
MIRLVWDVQGFVVVGVTRVQSWKTLDKSRLCQAAGRAMMLSGVLSRCQLPVSHAPVTRGGSRVNANVRQKIVCGVDCHCFLVQRKEAHIYVCT